MLGTVSSLPATTAPGGRRQSSVTSAAQTQPLRNTDAYRLLKRVADSWQELQRTPRRPPFDAGLVEDVHAELEKVFYSKSGTLMSALSHSVH